MCIVYEYVGLVNNWPTYIKPDDQIPGLSVDILFDSIAIFNVRATEVTMKRVLHDNWHAEKSMPIKNLSKMVCDVIKWYCFVNFARELFHWTLTKRWSILCE